MSENYERLLDATIDHLQRLKERGVRFVPVSPELVTELRSTPRKAASPGRPARRSDNATVTRPAPVATETTAPPPAPPATPGAEQVLSAKGPSSTGTEKTAKAFLLEKVAARALVCVKCPHLASSRKTVVFGVGNPDADLMFVGEAPGADEDVAGEPFVGKAGQLLTRIIETMGLRREDVYIANILKCRPDTPGKTAGNRKPTPAEMQTCIPYLHEQIDIIQPKVLVGLGGTAIEGLLNLTGITRLRGTWQTYRGIPLMPTYHPAFLLRNQDLSTKREVWEDMLKVMEKLGMPATEKQRSYFLK